MKTLINAAVAAAVAITGSAAPALASPYHGHDQRTVVKTVVVKQHGHRWMKGQRFDRRYARDYRKISNPRFYRLHNAPRGYRWVRSGNDAVLVGITSGIIAAVMANAMR